VLVALGAAWVAAAASERRNWFDTPFGQALDGAPGCPPPEGPMITEDEMRRQAHGRIERGTSCWLAGKCEDSNVYRRDPEIQARVIQALKAETRLARSSIWVTTERRFIALQGCLGDRALRDVAVERVRAVAGVEQVFDQFIVGTKGRPPGPVDPGWDVARAQKKADAANRVGGRGAR
jgi:osmotically-inducible protein OsmY